MWRAIPALAASVLVVVAGLVPADHPELDELVQIAPWDALHTITEPAFDDEPYVAPGNEVIGVATGGEAHTYPLKLMNYHEVINDVVGGVPIVVAYCPLCGTAIAYERTIDDTVLTFRTSGLLYRNNKVLFDAETGSLWPMLLGEAINGTYHGTRLRLVTTTRMPFAEWIELHPEARVVARPWGPTQCPAPCIVPPGFEGYDVNPYAAYEAGDTTLAPIRHPDDRLHPKAYVVGIVRATDAWAVAFSDLLRERAVNTIVGGLPIVIALAADPTNPAYLTSPHAYERGDSVFVVDSASNEIVDQEGARYSIRTGASESGGLDPVNFFYGFWFAWHDFHPTTRVHGYVEEVQELGVEHMALGGFLAVTVSGLVLFRWRKRRSSRGSSATGNPPSGESREKL